MRAGIVDGGQPGCPLASGLAGGHTSSVRSPPPPLLLRSYLTPDASEQGLLAVPCIVGQLVQIFMGSAFAPHLAALVTRREAAAKEAAAMEAAAAADVEAGAAAAAAPEADSGGKSIKSLGSADEPVEAAAAAGAPGAEPVAEAGDEADDEAKNAMGPLAALP